MDFHFENFELRTLIWIDSCRKATDSAARVWRSKQDLKNAKSKMREIISNMLELRKLAKEKQLLRLDPSDPCDSDENSDSSDSPEIPHPVFMNDVILQEIFRFLKPKDYMQCRAVCQKWKSVGEAHFKSTIQIYFNFCKPYTQFDLRVFLQNAQIEFPYRLVKFKGPIPLSTSNLTSFFATEGKFITHLTLKNINLTDVDLSINECRSYVHESNIMDVISGIENLKSLEIACNEGSTILNLSLFSLRTIKYINLKNCTIELSQTTIAPIELRLRSAKFHRDNLPVKVVRLNDFVEFGVMKKLVIIHPRSRDSTVLELDLIGNVTLSHLEFLGVKISNLEQTSWSVKSLNIYCGQFINRSCLKVDEFFLRFSKCDFRCLPQTVNKLSLGEETVLIGTDFRNISLPNIISLELIDKSVMKMCFPYLATSFNNLKELKLQRDYPSHCKIHVNQIPKSVEVLILGNSGFQFVGEEIFSLDSLIIGEDFKQNLQFIVHVTKHFSPKILKALVDMDTIKPCNRLIHLQSLLNTSIPRIMLGEVHERHYAYLKSRPSFESTGHLTGQIVNSNGSKITFSF